MKTYFLLFSSGMEGGRKETVLSSVQEMWEKSFREIGEDNPEHTVTGIIIFYPTYLIAYCEVRLLRCFFVATLNEAHRYQRNSSLKILYSYFIENHVQTLNRNGHVTIFEW